MHTHTCTYTYILVKYLCLPVGGTHLVIVLLAVPPGVLLGGDVAAEVLPTADGEAVDIPKQRKIIITR